jgi:asparagine synthase (glutamine-hydrolysing)
MCGIAGIYSFSEKGKKSFSLLKNAVCKLEKRGPDKTGCYTTGNAALGHTRLSIIDTSDSGSQPFTDHTGRYTIIFNGEFFNYKEHRQNLLRKGIPLKSETDTEVLLYLYIMEGPSCLEKINGFFAIAIHDKEKDQLFIARDRMGIKPLLIYQDEDKVIFASEMKAMMEFKLPLSLDHSSLLTYLQLTYIPAPDSIFKEVKKLEPGYWLQINKSGIKKEQYYSLPFGQVNKNITYDNAQKELVNLLDESVQKRLVSDVPLGTFLSGGIDSSVITALAARHLEKLHTFSIGFPDEPLYDETRYARLVADKYKTEHTVFKVTNQDLFSHLHDVLEYIDEPFADSSALNMHILCKHTKKHVTVALSGDGADELFAGYNKHRAEYFVRNGGIKNKLVNFAATFTGLLPQSRNSKFCNISRQLNKLSEGIRLNEKDRYWLWASFLNEKEAVKAVLNFSNSNLETYQTRRKEILKNIHPNGSFNEILFTDCQLVLRNDMLTKVDLMSMANSIEVRVPFLDYNLVDFAFSLPAEYKIDGQMKKRIVQDAFRNFLPEELYKRPKQGFEVPLLKWFKTELKSIITDELLSDKFIQEQGIFNLNFIQNLKQKLFSSSPGDAAIHVWTIIVFQVWWKKYNQL